MTNPLAQNYIPEQPPVGRGLPPRNTGIPPLTVTPGGPPGGLPFKPVPAPQPVKQAYDAAYQGTMNRLMNTTQQQNPALYNFEQNRQHQLAQQKNMAANQQNSIMKQNKQREQQSNQAKSAVRTNRTNAALHKAVSNVKAKNTKK